MREAPDNLWPCHYCYGEGWIWDAHTRRKLRCPACKGKGIVEEDEEEEEE
jgi:DnaJ-class molecular chaperone